MQGPLFVVFRRLHPRKVWGAFTRGYLATFLCYPTTAAIPSEFVLLFFVVNGVGGSLCDPPDAAAREDGGEPRECRESRESGDQARGCRESRESDGECEPGESCESRRCQLSRDSAGDPRESRETARESDSESKSGATHST